MTMSLWQNLIEQIKLNFFDFISSGHAFLINNVLQSFFFMMATIELITWTLHRLNLFFAKNFTKSRILQGLIFLLFFYLKIWNSYSAYMEILGYFCSVTICLHIYEGCIRMGTHFCQKWSKNSFGNVSSAISILLVFLSIKIFRLSQLDQKERKYPYVALYFLVFGLILIIGVLRKKKFIYVIILATMTGSIVLLRHWSIELLKDSFLQKASIPLQSIVYIFFALQENYNAKIEENLLKKLKGQLEENQPKGKVSELMWAQVFYYIFFLVNKRTYNIQIVLASICFLSYLGTRRFD